MSRGDSALFDDDGDDAYDAHDALCRELERLTLNASFTVAEFAGGTATIFEISRDEHGTPRSFLWEYRYANGALVLGDGGPDQWSAAMADPAQFYRRVAPRFIACTPGPLPSELRDLLPSR
ncbi:MAG: hypothetical protein JO244_01340, partial [Solirubrobacterales bacterium]|nr:hypothetical protein [Solirubrobacterales bacterium]